MDDIDPRDTFDEQALLPIEWRVTKFTDHCAVGLDTPEAPVCIEIGFTLRKTVEVDPERPVELRLLMPEADALSVSRAILDVLQGITYDRIRALSEPDDCYACGRNDNEGVFIDDVGRRYAFCHRHEDDVRAIVYGQGEPDE